MTNPVLDKELINAIVSVVKAELQKEQEDMEPPVVYFLDLDDMLQALGEAERGEWRQTELWMAVLSKTDETGTVSVGLHIRTFGRSLGSRSVILACYLPVAKYQAGDKVQRKHAIEKARELEQVVLEYLRKEYPYQFIVSRGVIPVGQHQPVPGEWARYAQEVARRKRQEALANTPPIESLGLSNRVRLCLDRGSLKTVGQLLDYISRESIDGLLCLSFFGKKALAEVKEKLIEHGYLAQDGETILWPPGIAEMAKAEEEDENADH